MSARGRPEALIPSAQREGSPISARGRSEALIPSAEREGSPVRALVAFDRDGLSTIPG